MNKDTFLSVKNLSVVYTSDGAVIHAVNDVSFDLQRGKTIGLVGETGAGKTSIAKAILGILPNPPAKVTGGEVWFEGENLLTKAESEMLNVRGQKISMIFQDPMTALNPLMTIGEQITEALVIHGYEKGHSAKEKAIEMLKMVGISAERYDAFPHELSGGMKQRVVIAIALACNPELLLADEPTTALDVTIQAQVLDMIRELRDTLGTSMILITHDLGVVAETCDDVAVVYAGEIIEMADKFSLFDHPTHPYTNGLFGSLPSMAIGEKRLHPIAGAMPDPANLPDGCMFAPRCAYATEKCRTEKIPLVEIAPGHLCRCCNYKAQEGLK
jgi:peptide/nickel transport system ATP-binding protein